MKWSELQRLAEKDGWVLVRFGKKHNEYQKGDRRVFLERHSSKEIKPGICHRLMKQMNLK